MRYVMGTCLRLIVVCLVFLPMCTVSQERYLMWNPTVQTYALGNVFPLPEGFNKYGHRVRISMYASTTTHGVC